MGRLDHEREIRVGRARSQKILSFSLITKTFLGVGMDVHPEVENDNSSFPNANPPSDTEDDFGDKHTAAETYFNNNGNNMKKIITMAPWG
jgi:hypothetical protein